MSRLPAHVEAVLSMPRPWRVTTTYADGAMKTLDQPFEKSAQNYAERESLKIGRDLIDRMTGKTVRITDVSVSRIQ